MSASGYRPPRTQTCKRRTLRIRGETIGDCHLTISFLFQVERGRADLHVDAGLPHEAGQSAEDPGPREAPLRQVHQEQRHRDAPSLGQRRDHASDTIPSSPRDGEPNGRRYVLKLSRGFAYISSSYPCSRALVAHLSFEEKRKNHRREEE